MPSHNHTKKDYNTESYNKEGYNGDKMFYGNPGTGEFQGTFQTDYTGKTNPTTTFNRLLWLDVGNVLLNF